MLGGGDGEQVIVWGLMDSASGRSEEVKSSERAIRS